MRNLFAVGVILLVSGVAASQTTTRPGSAPGAPSRTLPNEPSSARTVAQSPYLAEPFDLSASTISPDFSGHDIIAITKMLKDAPALAPKSEFETSDQYAQRKASFRSQRLIGNVTPDSYLAFVLDENGSAIKYDADSQILTATLVTKVESVRGERVPWEMSTVSIRSVDRGTREYVASNAFGVKVKVTETASDSYRLALAYPGGMARAHGAANEFAIGMSSDEARRVKPHVKLVVVCKLMEPWYRRSVDGHEATISEPYSSLIEVNYLLVVPQQFWIISDTGEVLRKFSPVR